MTGCNDIHEDDFPDHVKQMHQERDHKFELEYKVSHGIKTCFKYGAFFLSSYIVTGQVEWCIV